MTFKICWKKKWNLFNSLHDLLRTYQTPFSLGWDICVYHMFFPTLAYSRRSSVDQVFKSLLQITYQQEKCYRPQARLVNLDADPSPQSFKLANQRAIAVLLAFCRWERYAGVEEIHNLTHRFWAYHSFRTTSSISLGKVSLKPSLIWLKTWHCYGHIYMIRTGVWQSILLLR